MDEVWLHWDGQTCRIAEELREEWWEQLGRLGEGFEQICPVCGRPVVK